MTPQRLQASRKKGSRLPLTAKLVARPSRWGNPFIVWNNKGWWAEGFSPLMGGRIEYGKLCPDRATANRIAIDAYREAIRVGWYRVPTLTEIRTELAGHDLACWCPLLDSSGRHMACHADVLLELANS